MKKKPERVAIIGVGNRARCYINEAKRLGGRVQFVAMVDPDTDGAVERLQRLETNVPVYASTEEMLKKESDLDGIIICSPDNCHLESFQSVAHLNLPILLEKPVEGNAENFQKLEQELLTYKAPILVGHCMRHAPILKKAKELIDQNWIGKVTSMRFVQNCHYGDVFFRGWHRRSESITSLYLEKASHDFDIMHMLNDDNYAESIFAFSKRYKFGGDKPNDLACTECSEEVSCPESTLNFHSLVVGGDVVERDGHDKCVWAQEADIGDDEMCMIEFSNGVQGVYVQTFYTPFNYKGRVYTVVGTEGVMEINVGHEQGSILVHQRYGTQHDAMRYDFDYLGRNHYNGDTYLMRNFLGVMEGKEDPITTAVAAIASEKTGLAAVESVRTRQLVKVDISRKP